MTARLPTSPRARPHPGGAKGAGEAVTESEVAAQRLRDQAAEAEAERAGS